MGGGLERTRIGKWKGGCLSRSYEGSTGVGGAVGIQFA